MTTMVRYSTSRNAYSRAAQLSKNTTTQDEAEHVQRLLLLVLGISDVDDVYSDPPQSASCHFLVLVFGKDSFVHKRLLLFLDGVNSGRMAPHSIVGLCDKKMNNGGKVLFT